MPVSLEAPKPVAQLDHTPASVPEFAFDQRLDW
jgi:hypothetical protein